MTFLSASDNTIAASVREPAASAVSRSRCRSIRIDERRVICVLELRHDGRTLAHANRNAGVLEVMYPEDPVQSCDKSNG